MRYYIIAGEASGDLHGSNLMKALFQEDAEAQIRFWGGDLMREACTSENSYQTLVRHYKEGAVMGVTEVIAKAGKLLGNIDFCKKDILSSNPDVVILIDYPGFNMKIARFCHEKNIRVFYYIAPKTWASREGRNRALKKYIDRLFIVFPFEEPYFKSKGIPYIYEGNPLVDAIESVQYKRPCEDRYIALLPGSRKGEISRMMPICMEVADRLGRNVVIAGAPSRSAEDYLPYIGTRTNVQLLFGRTYDILKYADAAIINSGTASLEAALIGTPQVVCWSTSALTAFIARRILRVLEHVRFISLGNLCLGRMAFRELIQDDFNADAVAAEVSRLCNDESYRRNMLSDYEKIRRSLGGSGASSKVAKAMIAELRKV